MYLYLNHIIYIYIYIVKLYYYVTEKELYLWCHMFQTNYLSPNMMIGILRNAPPKFVVTNQCHKETRLFNCSSYCNTSFQPTFTFLGAWKHREQNKPVHLFLKSCLLTLSFVCLKILSLFNHCWIFVYYYHLHPHLMATLQELQEVTAMELVQWKEDLKEVGFFGCRNCGTAKCVLCLFT